METNGNLEEGNTKTSSRTVPSKYWCFTLNNYTLEILETLETMFKDRCDKYIIGKEVGEQGTPHLQGYIECKNKIRPVETFKIKEIHWEKRKGTSKEAATYCMKEKNYKHKGFDEYEEDDLDLPTIDDLYDWQLTILSIIKEKPDKRKIYWIWESQGNMGKTTFCKYLSYHHGAVPLEGKKNDILYCAAEFKSKIYVWDLERSMEDYVSYGAIEKIKNGYYMCAKYESKPVVRASPHIFIFANFSPDTKQLSEDRWVIINIGEDNRRRSIDLEDFLE